MPLIRAARPEDIPKLASIERSAASIFREANLSWVAEGETLPPASLAEFCRDGSLWVAVTDDDEPVGFLAAHELDEAFFIAEVSVAMSHQRQGIGRELIRRTQDACSPETRLVLLSAPKSVDYYPRVGFTRHEQCWQLTPGKRCL